MPGGGARGRAVIDIGDIDISIKMSCDIDIDIENVDIDILELGVTPVVELASLTTIFLKKHVNCYKPVWLLCLVLFSSSSSLAFRSLQFRFLGLANVLSLNC